MKGSWIHHYEDVVMQALPLLRCPNLFPVPALLKPSHSPRGSPSVQPICTLLPVLNVVRLCGFHSKNSVRKKSSPMRTGYLEVSAGYLPRNVGLLPVQKPVQNAWPTTLRHSSLLWIPDLYKARKTASLLYQKIKFPGELDT